MFGRIHSVVFDAADIKATASFYAQLAGFKRTILTKTGSR
jgi:hypothetical protein